MLKLSPKTRKNIEFACIIFGFMWAIFFPFFTSYEITDLNIFLRAGAGISQDGYYYTPWMLPFWGLLSLFPYHLAAIIANCLSLSGYLLAVNIFKGNKILFFLSYPLLFGLFYGQVEGIFIGGFALAYWGIRENNLSIATLGFLIALCKWNIFLVFSIGLWLYCANPRQKIQLIIIGLVLFIASLIIWDNWLFLSISKIINVPPEKRIAITFSDIVGTPVFLLWVPVLLSRTRDLRWWVMTWVLTVPYFQIYSLPNILIFPLEGFGWIVQLGYLLGIVGFQFRYVFMVVPLAIYILSWKRSWSTDWLSVTIVHIRRSLGTRGNT